MTVPFGAGVPHRSLALGTATFGVAPRESDVDALVGRALDAGVTVLDTASSYGDQPRFDRPGVPEAGQRASAEELLGRALRGRRDEVVLCTKVGERLWEGPDGAGLGRRHVHRALTRSLRRLGTDHVDVLYAHHPDPATPVADLLTTFAELIDTGHIRHYGLSTFSSPQLREVARLADTLGVPRPVVHQTRHHVRDPHSTLRTCRDLGIPVAAFGALAGGLLTATAGHRRFTGSARWGGTGHSRADLRFAERFVAVAQEHGWEPAVLAISWALGAPGVGCAVIGPESVAELDALLPAVHDHVPDELRRQLDTLAAT